MDTFMILIHNKTTEKVVQAFELEAKDWQTAFYRCYDSYFSPAEAPEEDDLPYPDSQGVWHRDEIVTQHDGSVIVFSSTNDNHDSGYPSEHAAWQTKWPSKEAALQRFGKSGVGCLGGKLTVTLDGQEV